jgi:hypothetical protein
MAKLILDPQHNNYNNYFHYENNNTCFVSSLSILLLKILMCRFESIYFANANLLEAFQKYAYESYKLVLTEMKRRAMERSDLLPLKN